MALVSMFLTGATAASGLGSGSLNSLVCSELEVRKRKRMHPECSSLLIESSNTC